MPMGLSNNEPCRGRVLVVDDDAGIRRMVRLTLLSGGYEAIEAEDGANAIELMSSGDNPLRLDIIICDISMPKVHGSKVIAFFRERFPSIPIIVLTGYPDTESAVNFIKQGVIDYAIKPIQADKLLLIVAKAMEHRNALKP